MGRTSLVFSSIKAFSFLCLLFFGHEVSFATSPLDAEISQRFKAFQPRIDVKKQAKAIQFVSQLSAELKQAKDVHTITHLQEMIAAILTRGAGVGGISKRTANKDEVDVIKEVVLINEAAEQHWVGKTLNPDERFSLKYQKHFDPAQSNHSSIILALAQIAHNTLTQAQHERPVFLEAFKGPSPSNVLKSHVFYKGHHPSDALLESMLDDKFFYAAYQVNEDAIQRGSEHFWYNRPSNETFLFLEPQELKARLASMLRYNSVDEHDTFYRLLAEKIRGSYIFEHGTDGFNAYQTTITLPKNMVVNYGVLNDFSDFVFQDMMRKLQPQPTYTPQPSTAPTEEERPASAPQPLTPPAEEEKAEPTAQPSTPAITPSLPKIIYRALGDGSERQQKEMELRSQALSDHLPLHDEIGQEVAAWNIWAPGSRGGIYLTDPQTRRSYYAYNSPLKSDTRRLSSGVFPEILKFKEPIITLQEFPSNLLTPLQGTVGARFATTNTLQTAGESFSQVTLFDKTHFKKVDSNSFAIRGILDSIQSTRYAQAQVGRVMPTYLQSLAQPGTGDYIVLNIHLKFLQGSRGSPDFNRYIAEVINTLTQQYPHENIIIAGDANNNPSALRHDVEAFNSQSQTHFAYLNVGSISSLTAATKSVRNPDGTSTIIIDDNTPPSVAENDMVLVIKPKGASSTAVGS